MKWWLAALLVPMVFLADPVLARGQSGSHSSKSKSSNGYIVRHCKTEACFKKHPSGTYSFIPGEHKRKD